ICPPRPCGTADQSPRLLFAKMQQDVRCKIIGSIFHMSKNWHTKNVERSMSNFVQSSKDKLPDRCISRCNPGGTGFFRQRFQYVFQKIVAKSHRCLAILSPVPSIDDAAFLRLDGQLFG